jgi:hypothetical protein
MGMSQSQFAAEVLDSARVTLAQYESSKAPTSTLLKKLEDIAKREKERSKQKGDPAKYLAFRELQQTFYELQFAEIKERAGVDYKFFAATEKQEAGGFAFLRVRGYDEMMSLQTLLALWKMLRLDEKIGEGQRMRSAAWSAIDALNTALGIIDPQQWDRNKTSTKALEIIPRLTITRKTKTRTTTNDNDGK